MSRIWWWEQWQGLKTGKSIWLAVLMAVAVCCLWVVLYWLNGRLAFGLEMDMRNLYPSFAVVQTIFTGLAFWGVLVNIILLKKQAVNEREKYEKECRRADEKFNKQDFESKFWNMLNCLNDVREKIWIDEKIGKYRYFDFTSGKERIQGIDMIRYIYNNHLTDCRGYVDNFIPKYCDLSVHNSGKTISFYESGWDPYDYKIGAYRIDTKKGRIVTDHSSDCKSNIKQIFTGLYVCILCLESWMSLFFNIIIFIKESNLKTFDKQRYFKILKYSISREEGNILIYLGRYINDNCISKARNFCIEERILCNDFGTLITNKFFLQLMEGMYEDDGKC